MPAKTSHEPYIDTPVVRYPLCSFWLQPNAFQFRRSNYFSILWAHLRPWWSTLRCLGSVYVIYRCPIWGDVAAVFPHLIPFAMPLHSVRRWRTYHRYLSDEWTCLALIYHRTCYIHANGQQSIFVQHKRHICSDIFPIFGHTHRCEPGIRKVLKVFRLSSR